MLNRTKDLNNTSTATVKNSSTVSIEDLYDEREESKAEAERLRAEAEVARRVAEYLESMGFANLEEAIAGDVVAPLGKRCRRYRARGRRHLDNGENAAARRAFTGATLYLQGAVPSLIAAADASGSNPAYVKAMVILLRSEDSRLLRHALRGNVPLLIAAKRAKPVADLVTAFRAAGPTDLSTAGSIVGSAAVWDGMISPII